MITRDELELLLGGTEIDEEIWKIIINEID